MKEYSFRSAIPGQVESILNADADQGWQVEQLYKEGPKFWILLSREAIPAPSAKKPKAKKAAAKKAAVAAEPTIEEKSASKETKSVKE